MMPSEICERKMQSSRGVTPTELLNTGRRVSLFKPLIWAFILLNCLSPGIVLGQPTASARSHVLTMFEDFAREVQWKSYWKKPFYPSAGPSTGTLEVAQRGPVYAFCVQDWLTCAMYRLSTQPAVARRGAQIFLDDPCLPDCIERALDRLFQMEEDSSNLPVTWVQEGPVDDKNRDQTNEKVSYIDPSRFVLPGPPAPQAGPRIEERRYQIQVELPEIPGWPSKPLAPISELEGLKKLALEEFTSQQCKQPTVVMAHPRVPDNQVYTTFENCPSPYVVSFAKSYGGAWVYNGAVYDADLVEFFTGRIVQSGPIRFSGR